MKEYHIERLGHQGDGIAPGPIFAQMALPGEIVSGDIDGDRLKNLKILKSSSDRVSPICRHYKTCGGCQLQHASDKFVAGWKVGVVRQSLAAQGIQTNFKPIITSPPESRRRAVFSAKRTKKGSMAGFHARASHAIVEIQECPLLDPKLFRAKQISAELAALAGSRKGELNITATHSASGLDISVQGGKLLDGPLMSLLAQAAERLQIARLTWSGETISTRASPEQVFGNVPVVPPPGAFLQATTHGEMALLEAVALAVSAGGRGIDLFSGCGTFTLPTAALAQVHAVESDANMISALEVGWKNVPGLKRVTTEVRDLFRNPIIAEDLGYDFAIVDPPRAGAEAQVKELGQSKIKEIAFVSCNPITFARDAALLIKNNYTLEWVQVIDQFRWSSHIELVARFTRL